MDLIAAGAVAVGGFFTYDELLSDRVDLHYDIDVTSVDLGPITSDLGIIVGEEDSGGYYGGGSVKVRVGKFKTGVNVTADVHGQLQYEWKVWGEW